MNKLSKSIIKALAIGSLLPMSAMSLAQTLAITNATIHTASDKGVINNGTVLVEDGVITAINPANLNADVVVDAKGAMLTPGLIAPLNVLGLTEVSAVAQTNDYSDEKADMTFKPALAFNYLSGLIPYNRKGGITTAVITPYPDKDIFAGQTAVVNLSGEQDSVEQQSSGLLVVIGAKSKGSRAVSLQTLMEKLEDTDKALKKAEKAKKDKKDDDKEPSREEQLLNAVVKGEKPLIVSANRASDLLHLIELKKRFGLNLLIADAADAVLVKEQLAAAEIPVIIDPMSDLPGSFDGLHASLGNAATLSKAGVKVILHEGDTHNLYLQRFNAGNAVSYGMSKEAALQSMTSVPAQAFGIDAGTIEVGKPADLVLWHGDMFELSGYVEKMWINGKEYDTKSRQDALRDRYMNKGTMPEAYNK